MRKFSQHYNKFQLRHLQVFDTYKSFLLMLIFKYWFRNVTPFRIQDDCLAVITQLKGTVFYFRNLSDLQKHCSCFRKSPKVICPCCWCHLVEVGQHILEIWSYSEYQLLLVLSGHPLCQKSEAERKSWPFPSWRSWNAFTPLNVALLRD